MLCHAVRTALESNRRSHAKGMQTCWTRLMTAAVVLFAASLSAASLAQADITCCLLHTGKGRGMVVTEDVKAGTLLAVCNPLAIAYTDPSDFGFQIDPVTMSMVRPLADSCKPA